MTFRLYTRVGAIWFPSKRIAGIPNGFKQYVDARRNILVFCELSLHVLTDIQELMSNKLTALELFSACQLEWKQGLEFLSNSLLKGVLNTATYCQHAEIKYNSKGRALGQSPLYRYCVRGDSV